MLHSQFLKLFKDICKNTKFRRKKNSKKNLDRLKYKINKGLAYTEHCSKSTTTSCCTSFIEYDYCLAKVITRYNLFDKCTKECHASDKACPTFLYYYEDIDLLGTKQCLNPIKMDVTSVLNLTLPK